MSSVIGFACGTFFGIILTLLVIGIIWLSREEKK